MSFDKHFTMMAMAMAYEERMKEMEYKIGRLEACLSALKIGQEGYMGVVLKCSIDVSCPPQYRKLHPNKLGYCKICEKLFPSSELQCKCGDYSQKEDIVKSE